LNKEYIKKCLTISIERLGFYNKDKMQDDYTLPTRPPCSIKIDEKFEDGFSVLEEIGKGSFGVVKECVNLKTSLHYAAKFIRKTSKSKQEVLREVEMMNKLRHRKLVQIEDAFESRREMIIVMEYISGVELFEKIAEEETGNFTENKVIEYLKQILHGVDYMHKNDIVHLDLKPENILCLNDSGTPGYDEIKLIDFGLARVIKKGQKETVMCGTPEFVAPEVIAYEPVTTASDMWSLGVITYVLLSGESPFLGDDDNETYQNVTLGEFEFDDEDNVFDTISSHAKRFIEDLIVIKPKERLSAEQCLSHQWLKDGGKDTVINTKHLKQFLARRKWKKTITAVKAIGRFSAASSLFKSRNKQSNNEQSNNENPLQIDQAPLQDVIVETDQNNNIENIKSNNEMKGVSEIIYEKLNKNLTDVTKGEKNPTTKSLIAVKERKMSSVIQKFSNGSLNGYIESTNVGSSNFNGINDSKKQLLERKVSELHNLISSPETKNNKTRNMCKDGQGNSTEPSVNGKVDFKVAQIANGFRTDDKDNKSKNTICATDKLKTKTCENSFDKNLVKPLVSEAVKGLRNKATPLKTHVGNKATPLKTHVGNMRTDKEIALQASFSKDTSDLGNKHKNVVHNDLEVKALEPNPVMGSKQCANQTKGELKTSSGLKESKNTENTQGHLNNSLPENILRSCKNKIESRIKFQSMRSSSLDIQSPIFGRKNIDKDGNFITNSMMRRKSLFANYPRSSENIKRKSNVFNSTDNSSGKINISKSAENKITKSNIIQNLDNSRKESKSPTTSCNEAKENDSNEFATEKNNSIIAKTIANSTEKTATKINTSVTSKTHENNNCTPGIKINGNVEIEKVTTLENGTNDISKTNISTETKENKCTTSKTFPERNDTKLDFVDVDEDLQNIKHDEFHLNEGNNPRSCFQRASLKLPDQSLFKINDEISKKTYRSGSIDIEHLRKDSSFKTNSMLRRQSLATTTVRETKTVFRGSFRDKLAAFQEQGN